MGSRSKRRNKKSAARNRGRGAQPTDGGASATVATGGVQPTSSSGFAFTREIARSTLWYLILPFLLLQGIAVVTGILIDAVVVGPFRFDPSEVVDKFSKVGVVALFLVRMSWTLAWQGWTFVRSFKW